MSAPFTTPAPLSPPNRVLLGPGPSDVPASILAAMARPTVGHLDPYYLQVMDESRAMLQQILRTEKGMTMVMPGTGSAGMEACFANLVEPGDHVLVGVNGVFGGRMQDVAGRYGAQVQVMESAWGTTFDAQQVKDALAKQPGTKVVGIVQAETSTGALQDLTEISRVVHDAGALLLVDAVTSLGGVPVEFDKWNIDGIYSGSQKCLSCPPGLAPVAFSPAALAVMDARKTKVANWYLDISMIRNYWGSNRAYHHTAPINMSYALHEALRLVMVEGLENRFARHAKNHRALRAGVETLGLTYIPKSSLPMLNCLRVPEGIDDAAVRSALLGEYGIEIGAGLGPFKGQAWRIGLMGAASTQRNVTLVLSALGELMARSGGKVNREAALAAAGAVYRE